MSGMQQILYPIDVFVCVIVVIKLYFLHLYFWSLVILYHTNVLKIVFKSKMYLLQLLEY